MNRPVGKAEPLTAKDAMALQAMSLEDKIQLSTWGKMYEWYQACAIAGLGVCISFERLKLTHPQIYRYAMGGGAYDIIDNRWKPTAKGLGMDHALDVIGVAH